MNRRTVGWLAVTAQFALIGLLLFATRASAVGPRWLWWAGTACLSIGLGVAAVGLLNLGRALTPTPVPNGAALQQGGLYRLIRHPIYTGLLLATLGVVLRSPGWWPLGCWLLLLALLNAKARWEERMLSEQFEEYTGYLRRTGRFLPRLRDRRT